MCKKASLLQYHYRDEDDSCCLLILSLDFMFIKDLTNIENSDNNTKEECFYNHISNAGNVFVTS